MNRPPKPPYDFGQAVADYELKALPEQIEANNRRVLSGELDDNLVTIFHSLRQQNSELACTRYYYAGATVEELLDGFGKAGLAVANMFRQLIPRESSKAKFSWEGIERTVPALPGPDSNSFLNSGKLPEGLSMALLGGRAEDVAFLANLEKRHYSTALVREHPIAPQIVACCQALFRGEVSDDLTAEADALMPQVDEVIKATTPASKLLRAEQRMFLALAAHAPGAEALARVSEFLDSHKRLFDRKPGLPTSLLCFHAIAALVLLDRRGIPIDIDHPYAPRAVVGAAIARNRASSNG